MTHAIPFVIILSITLFFILIQIISGVLSILLPIPTIPKITGKYEIGTKLLCFDTTFYSHNKHKNNIDNNIEEEKDQKENLYKAINQQFCIRLWYPININNQSINTYHRKSNCYRIHPKDEKLKNRIYPNKNDLKDGYYYTIFLSKNCFVNSVLNGIPYKNTKFPLIIYTHGQNSYPERNTWFIEELTSNGYIVAAPYHNDRIKHFPGPVKQRGIDINFCIKYMMQLNNGKYNGVVYNEFADLFDFTNGIALFGHSFGAMASVIRGANWIVHEDMNDLFSFYKKNDNELNDLYSINKIIALDPWFEYLDIRNKLINVNTSMIICSSDGWRNYNHDNYKLNNYIKKGKCDIYEIKLHDTYHSNLTDFGIYHAYKFGKSILPSLILKNRKDIKNTKENITFCDIGENIDSKLVLQSMIQIGINYFNSWKYDTKFDIDLCKTDKKLFDIVYHPYSVDLQ